LEPSSITSFGLCIPSWDFCNCIGKEKEMEMNPFNPMIKDLDEFYGKILSINKPINKIYLKLRLTKAIT
tara:strand:- start:210 stop:416 length:207 start_codon:yes stop_codon:yes gene_type:complete